MIDADALPLHSPAPVALLRTFAEAVPADELFTITVAVAEQPLASVTVTV